MNMEVKIAVVFNFFLLFLFNYLCLIDITVAEEYECIGLYNYPGWLALKYKEYTKIINTTWIDELNVPSGHLSEDDTRAVDKNNDEPFWREKFANNIYTTSKFYQETYKRNAAAMFHKHKIAYKYVKDEDGIIPDLDLQLISEKSFPEEYGIKTTCEFDPKKVDIQYTTLWPNRTVPLNIDISNETHRTSFMHGLNALQYLSCVKFVPAKRGDHFVHVTDKGDGCFAVVGMAYRGTARDNTSTYQTMSLGPNCYSHDTVVHETMHTLGFPHEHQRFDRDIYVNVNSDNIKQQMRYNYDRIFYPNMPKAPYRYDSIMHYFSTAFGLGDRKAMLKRLDNSTIEGGRFLTLTDVNRLNYMYGCTEDETEEDFESLDDVKFPSDFV